MVKGKVQILKSEEIMYAVQYPMLAHRYLAWNNSTTEWHKSRIE